ncbi:MAG: hypothetical protein OEX12_15170 [Gammaproteobacteria bacterium]|nr:hypothetical protein [Gammaproteobacteria bacterium]
MASINNGNQITKAQKRALKIRVENFDGSSETISLVEAIKTYGRDELYECLCGYSSAAAYFLVGEDGAGVYPVPYDYLVV